MNTLSGKLGRHNIFTIFSHLIDKIEDDEFTVNDLIKFDKYFSEISKELSDKTFRIKVERRQRRTWEEGKPIQVAFTIDIDWLEIYEIETFKSMARCFYSNSVYADAFEAGYLQLEFNSGYSANFFISFGSFGDSSTPKVSFSTDVYNESWDDTNSSKDHFRVPKEIRNLVNKLAYECRMNTWGDFLEKRKG